MKCRAQFDLVRYFSTKHRVYTLIMNEIRKTFYINNAVNCLCMGFTFKFYWNKRNEE